LGREEEGGGEGGKERGDHINFAQTFGLSVAKEK
jgi:hypothetical protein